MNYAKKIRRVMRFGRLHHRGCEVTVRDTGYEVFGMVCSTKKEVDEEIDRRLILLNRSLNRIKPHLKVVK